MTDEQVVIKPEVNHHRTWTEAPASWNIRYRIGGYDEQITLRGDSYAEIAPMVDKAREYVARVIKAAPGTSAAVDAVNTEYPKEPYAAPAPQQTTAQGGTFDIVKMTTTPRQDGKVDLNFFEAGHQYADIRAVKTPAEAALMLQPTGGWTPDHFGKMADYAVKMLIYWTPSEKLNKNGKPYKNIVSIKPKA